MLVTTDMMVERVHFDLRFITPYQLGFKLISVNVSDIYAMGGQPAYVLLNIALTGNTEAGFVDGLFDGIQDALKAYRAVLIGGDLSASKKDLSLSATLIGYTRRHILRSGARAGDRIYVTGTLGESACGLELLKKINRPIVLRHGPKSPDFKDDTRKTKTGGKSSIPDIVSQRSLKGLSWQVVEPVLRRHLMPTARSPKQYTGCASAMIDVSDGLLIDLTRLCEESRVGARICERKIPVSAGMKKVASSLGISPLRLALTGGEDYELLFTAPPGKKVRAIYIGDIVKSGRTIADSEGIERTFSAEGYQHFRT
jgi:thiamine-monophosphate kinase